MAQDDARTSPDLGDLAGGGGARFRIPLRIGHHGGHRGEQLFAFLQLIREFMQLGFLAGQVGRKLGKSGLLGMLEFGALCHDPGGGFLRRQHLCAQGNQHRPMRPVSYAIRLTGQQERQACFPFSGVFGRDHDPRGERRLARETEIILADLDRRAVKLRADRQLLGIVS